MSTWCRPGSAGPAVNAPGGRLHLDLVARPHLVHQPGGEQPAGHLAHADPRRGARPARRSSTSGAPRAVAHRPQGERLAGPEGEGRRQVARDVEGDRDRVVGQPLDRGDPQRCGSRCGRAPRRASSDLLHVLERLAAGACSGTAPCRRWRRTRDSSSVSARAAARAGRRRGGSGRACSGTGPAARRAPARAGRCRAAASLRRPVVGDPVGGPRRATAPCAPRRSAKPGVGAARARRSSRMRRIAGQPE